MQNVRMGDVVTVFNLKGRVLEITNDKALVQFCRRTSCGKLLRLFVDHKSIKIYKKTSKQNKSGGKIA